MEERKIELTMEEYKQFLRMEVRIDILKKYISDKKYADRSDIADIMRFEIHAEE